MRESQELGDPLLVQRGGQVCLAGLGCSACGHVSFPVRPVCPNCLQTEVAERPIGLWATLMGFTISHVAPEGFEAPLVQAWVKADEGPELFSLLFCTEEDAAALSLGQRLKIETVAGEEGIERWGYRPIFEGDGRDG